jgi:hypothetical protein
MAVFGECCEITKLSERDHDRSDKLIESTRQFDWT